jgi:hypothetical protein
MMLIWYGKKQKEGYSWKNSFVVIFKKSYEQNKILIQDYYKFISLDLFVSNMWSKKKKLTIRPFKDFAAVMLKFLAEGKKVKGFNNCIGHWW